MESVILCQETHMNVNCEVAMGLVCIRPNRGAEKMEPFIMTRCKG